MGNLEKINEFKLRYLKQLSTVNSLKNSWDVWGEKIEQIIDYQNWGQSAFNIGDKISDVFLSTKELGASSITF